jgi:hypothetical protein
VTESFSEQAIAFANRLSTLATRTIGSSVEFAIIEVDDRRRRIGPGPFDLTEDGSGFQWIGLPRACDDGEPARLFPKVEFEVGMDPEDQHLAVRLSTFGLWVRPGPKRGHRPVVRVKYDRDATAKPASHVHLHAELAWVYGTAGESLPRLHEIHFPVGGKRFRPTVEEFLLFLHRGRLFRDWVTTNWRAAVDTSLGEWEERQARSTVRRFPDAATDQLRSMGCRVQSPAPMSPLSDGGETDDIGSIALVLHALDQRAVAVG